MPKVKINSKARECLTPKQLEVVEALADLINEKKCNINGEVSVENISLKVATMEDSKEFSKHHHRVSNNLRRALKTFEENDTGDLRMYKSVSNGSTVKYSLYQVETKDEDPVTEDTVTDDNTPPFTVSNEFTSPPKETVVEGPSSKRPDFVLWGLLTALAILVGYVTYRTFS